MGVSSATTHWILALILVECSASPHLPKEGGLAFAGSSSGVFRIKGFPVAFYILWLTFLKATVTICREGAGEPASV